MVRKCVGLLPLIWGASTTYSMEKEPVKLEYLEDTRSLQQEKGLYFNMLPKDVLGIVQHYRLAELLEREVEKALGNKYQEALRNIAHLAQVAQYAQLFNNPRFMDSLIQKVTNEFGKDPEEVARDINTQGAQAWLTHIRPDQLKLLNAADEGDLVKVQQLIATGINVNARSVSGWTALTYTAYKWHIEVVKMLIEAGANVNAQDNKGETALIWAAQWGQPEIVKILIVSRANVNAQDQYGWTALMWAAYKGHTEIVEELIAADADVTARDTYGQTALDIARKRGHPNIVKLLEKAQRNKDQA